MCTRESFSLSIPDMDWQKFPQGDSLLKSLKFTRRTLEAKLIRIYRQLFSFEVCRPHLYHLFGTWKPNMQSFSVLSHTSLQVTCAAQGTTALLEHRLKSLVPMEHTIRRAEENRRLRRACPVIQGRSVTALDLFNQQVVFCLANRV